MLCPVCGQETRVIETDKLESMVVRVRWCKNPKCRQIFETHEAVSAMAVRTPPPKTPPRVRTGLAATRSRPEPGQGPVRQADPKAREPKKARPETTPERTGRKRALVG